MHTDFRLPALCMKMSLLEITVRTDTPEDLHHARVSKKSCERAVCTFILTAVSIQSHLSDRTKSQLHPNQIEAVRTRHQSILCTPGSKLSKSSIFRQIWFKIETKSCGNYQPRFHVRKHSLRQWSPSRNHECMKASPTGLKCYSFEHQL
jgi:hypothetical protein